MDIVAFATIKLTLIAVVGFLLYRKQIIEEKAFNFLIFLVINITVPCMAFSHLIENLKNNSHAPVGTFLLLSFSIFGASALLGFLFPLTKRKDLKREFVSVVSFQNCGYLPLNIALFLFPAALREEFITYTFLYILGFDILMWSMGSFLIFKKAGERFKLSSVITAPIVGTLTALLCVYTGIARFIPSLVLDPMRMVGDTSFVLSMIILGCWLARIKPEGFAKLTGVVMHASFIKLLVLPFLALLFVLKFNIVSLFGLFIVLQASMPSAVTLPIVARMRNANSEFVSQGVLFTHIFSIFTTPFWLGLYLKFSHYTF